MVSSSPLERGLGVLAYLGSLRGVFFLFFNPSAYHTLLITHPYLTFSLYYGLFFPSREGNWGSRLSGQFAGCVLFVLQSICLSYAINYTPLFNFFTVLWSLLPLSRGELGFSLIWAVCGVCSFCSSIHLLIIRY